MPPPQSESPEDFLEERGKEPGDTAVWLSTLHGRCPRRESGGRDPGFFDKDAMARFGQVATALGLGSTVAGSGRGAEAGVSSGGDAHITVCIRGPCTSPKGP